MTGPAGAPLVLLQSSDWHVGSPLLFRSLGLPEELRASRREELDSVPERAVLAAIDIGADGILLPGDLWDSESVPPSTLHRVVEALSAFDPRPVFVAPGNHDFGGTGGFYDPLVLESLGMRAWPPNVFVFRSDEWTAMPFPGRPDVTVVGRAFLSSAVESRRPLAPPPTRPETPLALLLLHGSLEGYGGPDAPAGAKRTAPFSREELEGAGFSWAAVGHHHAFEVIEGRGATPLGAYAGSPVGRGLDETGPRSFVAVTLRHGEPPRVDRIASDPRSVWDLGLDAGGMEAPRLLEAARELLRTSGVAASDLVRITVSGRQPYGARPSAALEGLRSSIAHLTVRDRTSPVAGSKPDPATAEGRFAADLLARREQAADERSRRVIDLALSLGRDALAGRSVVPPAPEDL